MILVDCVTGTPSFIQMNVSGGDPDEMQDNVKEDPMIAYKVDDDDGVVNTGAAV